MLIGGNKLLVPYILTKNGTGVSTSLLPDTGALALLLIYPRLANRLLTLYNTNYISLDTAVPVRGFNGKPAEPIHKIIVLNLYIDSRRFRQLPILVCDIGPHDLIIGQKFFEIYKVDVSPSRSRLIWPENLPISTRPYLRDIIFARENLLPRSV